MRVRQAAGGGRAVELSPERLPGWFSRFAERHGDIDTTQLSQDAVVVRAIDGTTAAVTVPFPPLPAQLGEYRGLRMAELLAHARRSRRLGLVLIRRGAHSIGVVQDGVVVASRTDRHLVQGRSAAGGTSQQRFARRREGQARRAFEAAADDVAELLLPRVAELDALVLGGDRQAIELLRSQPRLRPLMALAAGRVLDVAEPRRRVLDEAARRARSVEIVVGEPGG